MIAFCTHCSAEKQNSKGLLPAIERYRDTRIREVNNAAKKMGAEFLILSGEYGLLFAQDPIPFYDHRLTESEVPALSETIRDQLSDWSIEQIVFFSLPLEQDPLLAPYWQVLQNACAACGIQLTFVELVE